MSNWEFNRNSDDKIEIVFNDFVVEPDICNFSCKYCLGKEKPIWLTEENCDSQKNQLIYSQDSELYKQLSEVMEKYKSIFDACILRISGGEIFLIKDIVNFFERYSSDFERIQIITNGYCLSEEVIEKLRNIPKCHLHISLDGHTFQLNSNRVKSEYQQKVLMRNVENVIKAGINLEIGSVISNANTKEYSTFLDYLLQYENSVQVFPFPLRGEIRKKFQPDKDSIECFGNILKNYSKYETILYPYAYLEEMYKILTTNKRVLQCHIPKTMLQFFDNGNISPCPNGWTDSIGNLLMDDSEEIKKNIGKDKIYSLFFQNRPRLSFCQQCYTSLDILNLYLGDLINESDLKRIPLYNGEKTLKRLKNVKNRVLSESNSS